MKFKVLAFLFFALLVGIVFVADTHPWLFARLYRVPLGDKFGHFLLMGTLALLVNLAWPQQLQIGLFKGTPWVLTLVLLEEISQIWLPVRTFSLLDLVFDLGGILILGELLARRLLGEKTGWVGVVN